MNEIITLLHYEHSDAAFRILATALPLLALLLVLRRTIRVRSAAWAHHKLSSVAGYVNSATRATNGLFLVIVSVAAGLSVSAAPPKLEHAFLYVLIVAAIIQAGLWADALTRHRLDRVALLRKTVDPSSISAFGIISFLCRVTIWALVALLVLDNIGLNITTLVAGLGLGSVAVALAVQRILGDIFSSISIVLDKPFEVGDAISVGGLSGVVEQIGIKSTRIRAVGGEQIIMPNADLLASRIQNFKRMDERRVQFNLSVEYGTPRAKLEQVPLLIKQAIEAQANLRFDRAHLRLLGESAVMFEAVYFVLSPDYQLFTAAEQAINLALIESFEREQIRFAFPTRTVLLTPNPVETKTQPRAAN